MVKNLVIGVLVVALVSVGLLYLGQTLSFSGSGQDEYFVKNFKSGLTIGDGTAVSKFNCGTATWNPASITSSTDSYTTTSVTVSGATAGDVSLVSLASVTSTNLWKLTSKVIGTDTVQVTMTAQGAVDLTTTTAKACVFH